MARLLVNGGLGSGGDGIVRDLDVADGELYALVGPTSWTRPLLRSIAGLEPTPFEVQVGDQQVGQRNPEERGLGFVFPAGALFPHLTVVDNLSFPLVGKPRYQVEERLAEVTKLAGLERVLSRKPAALSPIERLRVSIGRSLMRQPQVLLLDEPLASAEPSLRSVLRDEILRLVAGARTTAIFSTPDTADALAMANRIALHAEGGVRQVGTPLELYANPVDCFVAAVVGSPPMNVCTLPVTDGLLGFGGTSLKVSAQREIVLGLRPEELCFGQAPAPAMHLRGVLERVELEGAFARVAVQVSGVRLWVHCETRLVPSPSGEITLSVDPRCVHLFSADALGNRIPWESESFAPAATMPPPVRAKEAPLVAEIQAETQPPPIVEPGVPVAAEAPAPPADEQPAPIAEPVPPPPIAEAPAPVAEEPPPPSVAEEPPPPPPKVEAPPAPVSVAPEVDPDARRSRRPRFGKKRRSASR